MREIFSAFQCHTYSTVFEPFHFDQKARCQTYRTLSSRVFCPQLNIVIETFTKNDMYTLKSLQYFAIFFFIQIAVFQITHLPITTELDNKMVIDLKVHYFLRKLMHV